MRLKDCFAVLALVVLVCLSPSARADTILVGTTDSATGVTGLLVDGALYDVTFFHDTYSNVYGSNTPIFAGNGGLAGDAAIALSSALNALGVTGLVGNPPGFQAAVIPYQIVPDVAVLAQHAFNLGNDFWSYQGVGNITFDATFGHNDIAVFTAAAAVPGPIVGAGLPGLMLAALGLFGWRRRQRAH